MSKAGTSWRIVQCRPGSRPIRALAKALSSKDGPFGDFRPEGLSLDDIVEATLRMSKIGLVDIYEQAQTDAPTNLLVVVDQFEELFRYRSTAAVAGMTEQQRAEEATAFVNLLLEPKAQPRFPIYVVLTMRSDFLGDCAQFSGLPEAMNESQYLVPRMTREERRAAIAGPVSVGGAKISPVLLTRLVNDVGDNPDQLSILQHALNRTWARWQSEGRREEPLSLTHYEAIGTMAHALDQHAEKAYFELTTDRQKDICQKLFKTLTDKGTDPRGIRRPTSMAALCTVAVTSHDELVEVLKVFRKPSRSFLMPPEPESLEPDTPIDISHETLMRVWDRLRLWADEEAESARFYRRLSDTAALYKAQRAGLWRDPELQLALDWRDRAMPSSAWADMYGGGFDSAMKFLSDSEAQRKAELKHEQERQEREQAVARDLALAAEQIRMAKRLRGLAVALGIMCLASLALAWFANSERRKSVRSRGEAYRQEKLATQKAKEAAYQETLACSAHNKLEASLNLLANVGATKANVEAVVDTNTAALFPRVYMQIIDESDRKSAEQISQRLRKAGMIVLGVELVRKAAKLSRTEVRYYKKAEEPIARKIVEVLEAAGYSDVRAVHLSNFENSENVRANHYEVWLAHNSSGP
jgi:hypothetical protein